MPVPKAEVLELMRMEVDPAELDEIRELWKEHSKAEDDRSIEGLLATLTEDCVYTVYPDDVSWHGHEGAASFAASAFAKLTGRPAAVAERMKPRCCSGVIVRTSRGPEAAAEDGEVVGELTTHEATRESSWSDRATSRTRGPPGAWSSRCFSRAARAASRSPPCAPSHPRGSRTRPARRPPG